MLLLWYVWASHGFFGMVGTFKRSTTILLDRSPKYFMTLERCQAREARVQTPSRGGYIGDYIGPPQS